MKKIKLGLVALLLTIGSMAWAQTGNAQTAKTPEEKATAHTTMLTKKLGLSADQQKQVYSFCLQRAQQNAAAITQKKDNKEALQNVRKQNEDAFDKSLVTVLSPDQKTKYDQMKQEMQEKRQKEAASHGHSK